MDNVAQKNRSVLLHVCCGVCMAHPVQKLRDEGYTVTGYFFNPNIFPQKEYLVRLEEAKKMAKILQTDLIEGDLCHDKWQEAIVGFESEREGGKRCNLCFEMRLQNTADHCRRHGFDFFASTLSVSPHKSFDLIDRIGRQIDPERFLSFNFKKEDGFKKTYRAAKEHDIYCQNYCGCEFSMRSL